MGPASCTESRDGEVMRTDSESVPDIEGGGELGEHRIGNLYNGRAHVADEMLMAFIGEVINGAAVAEMDVVDHAEPLQRLERAVHGREVDVRS